MGPGLRARGSALGGGARPTGRKRGEGVAKPWRPGRRAPWNWQPGLHELLHVFPSEARDLLCAQVDKVASRPRWEAGLGSWSWVCPRLVRPLCGPQFPKSGEGACGGPESARNQQRTLVASRGGDFSAFGRSLRKLYSLRPPSVYSVSRAPVGLTCLGTQEQSSPQD